MGPTGPYALDFPAVLALASAMGADLSMIADLLARVEAVLIASFRESAE